MSKHHSITEVRQWLELREAEGLSIKQLALRSGIPAHVFIYRITRDKRSHEQPVEAEVGFVEVVASEPPPAEPQACKTSGIELAFPGGLRATLAVDFDTEALTRLLTIQRC
jgi:hypothetical protein